MHPLSVLGLEPKTFGLKDHCSTIELYTKFLVGTGFEPVKQYAKGLQPFPFDRTWVS